MTAPDDVKQASSFGKKKQRVARGRYDKAHSQFSATAATEQDRPLRAAVIDAAHKAWPVNDRALALAMLRDQIIPFNGRWLDSLQKRGWSSRRRRPRA